jgi:hypothetical protein
VTNVTYFFLWMSYLMMQRSADPAFAMAADADETRPGDTRAGYGFLRGTGRLGAHRIRVGAPVQPDVTA